MSKPRTAAAKVEKADDVPLSEIVEAEIDRVDGVLGPANGTPPLLMKSLPDDERTAGAVAALTKAAAAHEPFNGRHSHPHPAMGAQGTDETHDHEHSHDGDGDHGHAHEVAKAEMSTGEINDLPDSAFAFIEPGGEKDDSGKTTPRSKRHFPIHDKAHADAAAARIAQGAEFGDKAQAKVKAAQKKFGSGGAAKKAVDGEEQPGSPAWESRDAASLRDIATQLADLRDRLDQAAGRERAEAVEPAESDQDDYENAWDLDCACDALTAALGIVARLAFTEQQEASAPDAVAKAGRRLSAKSVSAIQAARDHLTQLLGESAGPEESEVNTPLPPEAGGTDVTKAELIEALDERLSGPLADLAKSQGDIAKALSDLPKPAGAQMASAEGERESEVNRQTTGGKPGMENPPPDAPALPDAGTELPGMEEAKRAATAANANPRLAKSTEESQAPPATANIATTETTTATGTAAVVAPVVPPALDTEALAKSLESSLVKSVEGAVKPLADGLDELRKRVDDIANQPMPGGPLLNGAAQRQDHYLVVRPPTPTPAMPGIPTGDDEQIRKALAGLRPEDRDLVGRALALAQSPFAPQQ